LGRVDAGLAVAEAAYLAALWRVVWRTASHGSTPSPEALAEVGALRLVVKESAGIRAELAAMIDGPTPKGQPDPFLPAGHVEKRNEIRAMIADLEHDLDVALREADVRTAVDRRERALAGRSRS
jgi:hypothetical protein